MKITRDLLENLVENIYKQVESDIGISRSQFIKIAGHGYKNAKTIGKNPTLKTILNLIDTRDKLLKQKNEKIT